MTALPYTGAVSSWVMGVLLGREEWASGGGGGPVAPRIGVAVSHHGSGAVREMSKKPPPL
ncbi:hypothetical protein GCM10009576_057660 [Streptomyces rhizosphaericus]|uniref:Uncharacterized protein n=1 Tax=Streptomyces rhizosphaericus TaxID=114699 RepID=A0ABN1SFL4_9ACTN